MKEIGHSDYSTFCYTNTTPPRFREPATNPSEGCLPCKVTHPCCMISMVLTPLIMGIFFVAIGASEGKATGNYTWSYLGLGILGAELTTSLGYTLFKHIQNETQRPAEAPILSV